jgi:hypothetical protein
MNLLEPSSSSSLFELSTIAAQTLKRDQQFHVEHPFALKIEFKECGE